MFQELVRVGAESVMGAPTLVIRGAITQAASVADFAAALADLQSIAMHGVHTGLQALAATPLRGICRLAVSIITNDEHWFG